MTTDLAQYTAAQMAQASPRSNNRDLVSLARRRGIELRIEREVTFSKETADGQIVPARKGAIRRGVATGDTAAILAFAEDAQRFAAPASQQMIEAWLAELSVITAKRNDDDMTEQLRLRAYTERLLPYPADIVRHALLVVTWKFWPTWDDLKRYCDEQYEERHAMLTAMVAQSRYEHRHMEPQREQMSEEERANVQKGIAELLKDLRRKVEAQK